MAIPEIAAASMLFVPKGGSHQAAAAERGVHRDSWRAEKHPSEKPVLVKAPGAAHRVSLGLTGFFWSVLTGVRPREARHH